MIPKVALGVEHITYRIGSRTILDDITMGVFYGKVLSIIGPNYSGKSTLLSLLSGENKPDAGEIWLDGRPLSNWRFKKLAQRRAVFISEHREDSDFTCAQVVKMGRSPWARISTYAEDELVIRDALEKTDTYKLIHMKLGDLSLGQRVRVHLARVFAQDTAVVLLDEPTISLDLGHKENIMKALCELADSGKAVAVVLNDLSLAANYSDEIVVIKDGKVRAAGKPEEIMTEDLIEDIFGVIVKIVRTPDGNVAILPDRRFI